MTSDPLIHHSASSHDKQTMIGRKNKATSIIAIAISLTVFVQVEAFLSTPAGPCIRQSLPFSLPNGKRKNQKVCINTICPRLHISYVPWEYVDTSSRRDAPNSDDDEELGPLPAAITKFGMIAYIACMCIALPMALFPTAMLYQSKLIDNTKCEHLSLQTGEACAYGLLQAIPFLNMKVIGHHEGNPEPSIWVCNHTSMLDVFILLASDEKLRGKNKRAIKAVYWQGLDENPVTKLLFHMCGFIPVQMAANGSGVPNEYDRASFRSMLKLTKKAFDDGFDVLVFPEGQLNPNPEAGLLPVYAGAYTLAKMSHRPIRFVALHGVHRLWHADENVRLTEQTVKGRNVVVRAYPPRRAFDSGEKFVETFRAVVGHFGTTGQDLPEEELQKWLIQDLGEHN